MTTGANLTIFSHINLRRYDLKCSYWVAIAQLCAVLVQSDLFGGASNAIATSAPGLLEVFMQSLAGHCASSTGQKRPCQLVCAVAMWSPPSSCLRAAGGLSLCLHHC